MVDANRNSVNSIAGNLSIVDVSDAFESIYARIAKIVQ